MADAKMYNETVIAKDQPEYLPLPSIISSRPDGVVTTRWRFTWKERFDVLFSGNLWLQQMTFHQKLQPVKMITVQPTAAEYL
jgi:hypothetical protein